MNKKRSKETESTYKQLLKELLSLTHGYSSTFRASISPVKAKQLPDITDTEDERVRESLLEHVGHLPIVATVLFPQLNDTEVDLGKSLVMLSIHDIGEVATGDKMIFQKQHSDSKKEGREAISLLDTTYHDAYEDIENQESKSGKFAKSVDKMVADILELLLPPKISHKRYKQQAGLTPDEIVPAKREKKMRYMEWNPFLKGFYNYLLDELDTHLTKE